jgi:hypothetical protein
MRSERDEGKPDAMSVLSETRLVPRPRRESAEPAGSAPERVRERALPPRTQRTLWSVRSLRYPSRRTVGWMLTAAGLAMLPWLFVLAVSLPGRATAQHWGVAWVGLDSLEALGLTCTGLLLRRRDPRASLTAAATAMLLLVDAWFDVLTSGAGTDRVIAVLMAGGAELPIAGLCGLLAVRLFPARR